MTNKETKVEDLENNFEDNTTELPKVFNEPVDKTINEVDEVLEEDEQSEEGEEYNLINEINQIRFLGDPIRFNKILYDGLQLLFTNIEKLQSDINIIKEKLK